MQLQGSIIALASFLLFVVQPLIAKSVLPLLGGSAAVWIVSMLVFQGLLLLGYAYAHASTSMAGRRSADSLHVLFGLLVLIQLLWSVAGTDWQLSGVTPQWAVIKLLLQQIGLPFVFLAATSPLLQAWMAGQFDRHEVYHLYIYSNAGSLGALLAYPFLIEPALPLATQRYTWTGLCMLCVCLVLACRMQLNWSNASAGQAYLRSAWKLNARFVAWISFAASGVAVMLAVSDYLSSRLAVVPFLWLLPLALYLLTYIVCFSRRQFYRRIYTLTAFAVCMMFLALYKLNTWSLGVWHEIILYCAALFFACFLCHGELYRLRPEPKQLTSYYLAISVGGFIGGLLVGIVAPSIFTDYVELSLSLQAVCILLLANNLVYTFKAKWSRAKLYISVGAVTVVLAGVCVWLSSHFVSLYSPVAQARNFYGVVSLTESVNERGMRARHMYHGSIEHGMQWQEAAWRKIGTTYYGAHSGVGRLLGAAKRTKERTPWQVAFIGLGVGTLATYGIEGDQFTFFELNPIVEQFARTQFSFLADSLATIKSHIQDGRLGLLQTDAKFDAIIIDAFSSGTIPAHLMTLEAVDLYLSRLRQDGVIAFHISNHYFDLRPVVARIAQERDLCPGVVISPADVQTGVSVAWYAFIARECVTLSKKVQDIDLTSSAGESILWTDDYQDYLGILK